LLLTLHGHHKYKANQLTSSSFFTGGNPTERVECYSHLGHIVTSN